MVLLKEGDDAAAHPIITRLTDESGIDAGTAEGNQAIEHRASRHCSDRLVILEDDIENGLAYSYYFTHNLI